MSNPTFDALMHKMEQAKPNPWYIYEYVSRKMLFCTHYNKLYPGHYLPSFTRYSQAIFWTICIGGFLTIRRSSYSFTNEHLKLGERKYYTMPPTFQNCVSRWIGLSAKKSESQNGTSCLIKI